MNQQLKLYEAAKSRRSIYALDKQVKHSQEDVVEMIQFALKHSPHAFNSQSGRVAILFGDNHQKLWDLTKDILRELVPDPEQFKQTEEKIKSFADAYGTVLFFEDMSVVKGLQEQFPLYADKFLHWSDHGSGMLQYLVWTILEAEGLGASLQHYNPLIDEKVAEGFDIPKDWQLVAQMPFGNPLGEPQEKEFSSLEDRVRILS